MNISQLRVFCAVTECGSFHKAAERLHMTQPAVTRSIQGLEAELGGRLIDRSGRIDGLTALGALTLKRAREILGAVQELTQIAAAHSRESMGSLRIGLGITASSILMVPLMRHFAVNHPNIELHLARGNAIAQTEALKRRQLDALVTSSLILLDRQGLDIEELGVAAHQSVLCHADHPLARAGSMEFDDLRHHRIIMAQPDKELYSRALLVSYGLPPDMLEAVTMTCDDVRACIEVVRDSAAVCLGFSAALRPFAQPGVLTEIPILRASTPASILSIVTVSGRSDSGAMAKLRSFVKDHVRDLAETVPDLHQAVVHAHG